MPDFASSQYWQNRFSKEPTSFDWLIPSRALCAIIGDWTDAVTLRSAEILHIGCGTSNSYELRQLVESPDQIHNVDFSEIAIKAASQNEDEQLAQARTENGNSLPPMRWSSLDLLSLESTLTLIQQQISRGQMFDIVLDKSTSDSIACGSGLSLSLPYDLSVNGWTQGITDTGVSQTAEIHPLHVLAVHLAAVTRPRFGKWIVVSYSEDRFPFLPPFPPSTSQGLLTDEVINAGFPHPQRLWRLEAKEKITVEHDHEETLARRKRRLASEANIYRPQISHWLYVLVRTAEELT